MVHASRKRISSAVAWEMPSEEANAPKTACEQIPDGMVAEKRRKTQEIERRTTPISKLNILRQYRL